MSERDNLTSRVLPEMVLSTGDNPLTRPLDQAQGFTPAQRAASRFAVSGNAIITGGLGNIALVCARALLEHGLSGLALLDLQGTIKSPAASAAFDSLQRDFPDVKIHAIPVDVSNADSVSKAVDEAAEEMGSINICICFAGIVSCVHATDLTPGDWSKTLQVNTSGSFFVSQAVAKRMIAQQSGGAILLTASISAHAVNFPQPQVAYNASKGALLQLSRSLSAEWARYGIRVNTISPGYIDTILNHGEGLAHARSIWNSRNPTGRMGSPEELTGAVVLFCSSAGRWISGSDLIVDGGGHVF